MNKPTISDIIKTLPQTKNKKYKSAGVYMIETDTSGTGRTNQSDGFNQSTDPLGYNDTNKLIDRIIIPKQ